MWEARRWNSVSDVTLNQPGRYKHIGMSDIYRQTDSSVINNHNENNPLLPTQPDALLSCLYVYV